MLKRATDGSVDRLNWLIDVSGTNRNELRRLSGLKGPSIYHLFLGRQGLRAGTWANVAAVFGVSLDWLLSGTGRKPDTAQVLRSVAAARVRERSAKQAAA